MATNMEPVSESEPEDESVVEEFQVAPEPFLCMRYPPIVKSKEERRRELASIIFDPSDASTGETDIEVGQSDDNGEKSTKLQQRLLKESGRKCLNEKKPFKDLLIEWFTSKNREDFDNSLPDINKYMGSTKMDELVHYEPPKKHFLDDHTERPTLLKEEVKLKNEESENGNIKEVKSSEDSKEVSKNGLEEHEREISSVNKSRREDIVQVTNGMSFQQLQDWKSANLNNLDQSDPKNKKFLSEIEDFEKDVSRYPRANIKFKPSGAIQKEIRPKETFCSLEQELNRPRMKMILLRASGAAHLKNVAIPLHDREVPIELLNGNQNKVQSKFSGIRGIEAKREKGVSTLNRLKDQLLLQSQGRYDRPRTLEDLVHEEESSSLTFGFNFFKATEEKRPLHPVRRERKKILGSLASAPEIKFIITVMHALNVPLRTGVIGGSEDSTSTSGVIPSPSIWRRSLSMGTAISEAALTDTEPRVCPFVEVTFQRESVRTSTAQGPQPTWNETLALNFRPFNKDLSPTNLTKITESIYLNLFDEVTIPGDLLTNQPVKLERRWIGSLRIPFSTLYLNSKIEGTFCLSVPPVLFGYDYESRFTAPSMPSVGRRSSVFGGNASETVAISSSEKTYLNLFITIDPTLQRPEELALKCDSAEDEALLNYCQKWESEYQTEYPNRQIRTVAVGLNAEWTLVTRYLLPLKPPEEFFEHRYISDEMMMRKLARFVALIPNVPDTVILPGVGEVWTTCQEFLDMMMGDEEEHAILLCNYFLYLKPRSRCGIVIGSGIPEGPTAYVIVWSYSDEDTSLWNPMTGQQFSTRDPFIPLITVGCIITKENVHANVQIHDHPNRVNFDLSKNSNWRPLFGRKFAFPQGLPSVQEESMLYSSIDREYVEQLQERIEKHLRESLMRWRNKMRTFYNRSAIKRIRKILPRLELKFEKLEVSDILDPLKDLLLVQKVLGYPLNMPYSDINSVTEAVYATGVHLTDHPTVEFVLAVYIHPYPCNVMSLWVYVGALT